MISRLNRGSRVPRRSEKLRVVEADTSPKAGGPAQQLARHKAWARRHDGWLEDFSSRRQAFIEQFSVLRLCLMVVGVLRSIISKTPEAKHEIASDFVSNLFKFFYSEGWFDTNDGMLGFDDEQSQLSKHHPDLLQLLHAANVAAITSATPEADQARLRQLLVQFQDSVSGPAALPVSQPASDTAADGQLEVPVEKWAAEAGVSPSEFLTSAWADWLEAGKLYKHIIRRHDPSLLNALNYEFTGRPDAYAELLPPKSVQTERLLAAHPEAPQDPVRQRAFLAHFRKMEPG